MTPEIRDERYAVVLYGASKRHERNTCYGDEIRALLDLVWPILKQSKIPNRGLNHVVYGAGDNVFAGVEAEITDAASLGLKMCEVRLDRYAYGKHVGPYSLLPNACESLHKWIQSQGFRAVTPLVEVYGHWTEDDSKLETELIQALE